MRTAENLNKTIRQYLQRHSLDGPENSRWEIRKSELGGFGIFASRNLEVGELIFSDHPVVLGPRAARTSPLVCVSCYKKGNLRACDRECGLPVCSSTCQNSDWHRKECTWIKKWRTKRNDDGTISGELVKAVTPIRALLLDDADREMVGLLLAHKGEQHGQEVAALKSHHYGVAPDEEAFMLLVCRVLDSNAFEVNVRGDDEEHTSVRGLYPLASLANHACVCNTSHVFDDRHRMVVRATVFIPENAEIFHSYSRLIWGTPVRRFYLHTTKHFQCKCRRCCDPTELGAYTSAVLCKKCRGRMVAVHPLKAKTDWRCECCSDTISGREVAALVRLLGSVLNSFTNEDVEIMLKFLNGKLSNLVPENHEAIIELKCKIIWTVGYSNGMTWPEIPNSLLATKEKYCRDVLKLLEILGAGECKMKGLLLYELYSCLKEVTRRNQILDENSNLVKMPDNEMTNLLNEAADILLYDVNAPQEIKQKWTTDFN